MFLKVAGFLSSFPSFEPGWWCLGAGPCVYQRCVGPGEELDQQCGTLEMGGRSLTGLDGFTVFVSLLHIISHIYAKLILSYIFSIENNLKNLLYFAHGLSSNKYF